MNEELIISGRNIPGIDPHLEIWHWPIALYLFFSGLAAGILFFASLYTILGKENKFQGAVKRAPILAPFLLLIGVGVLFLDLRHKLYFWQLYTTLKIQSPMSWGAWTLLAITPLSIIWVAIHIKEFFPKWTWQKKIFIALDEFFNAHKITLAWCILVLSVILGIYTGILFSAFNARPLWNTSILGFLFFSSGLSGAAALIIMFSKREKERLNFAKTDVMLIGIELFLILHMFMGFLASTEVQIEAAKLFLGGEYTFIFWGMVVILGLLIPACLELLKLRGIKIPVFLPIILILIGGFLFRYVIVEAGQMTRYLY
jgi:formate-dependent nitrite reductase membrane component NrfD